jgi:hypothetical protein
MRPPAGRPAALDTSKWVCPAAAHGDDERGAFDVALVKFNRSQSNDSPYEHLVDLPTAPGAALIGAERAPIHALWGQSASLVLRCEN